MTLKERLASEKAVIEAALDKALPSDEATPFLGNAAFNEAVQHAVKIGGKRVRPILTRLCAEACQATEAQLEDALHAAVAIELLHSYTLVHDDLPAMDNDTERRGAPSVWAKFGEGDAILVGDFLQTLAFEQLLKCKACDTKALLQALSFAAHNVIRGQVSDIAAAKVPPAEWTPELLGYVFVQKTSALIAGACKLGAIAANATPEQQEALYQYGVNVGLAFQYVDDLLDAQQSQTGNELNALAVWDNDPDVVRMTAEYCTKQAIKRLSALPGDTTLLADFAKSLLSRLA